VSRYEDIDPETRGLLEALLSTLISNRGFCSGSAA
jgi:hypothetical protein